jgi:mRNA interferase MazF
VNLHRGEVWLATLDPTVGSEIRKTRPCLIISPPEIHDHLRTAIVAPLTTGSSPAPFRPEVEFQGKRGRIVLEQLLCLDRCRLTRRLGKIDEDTMGRTLACLGAMFAD